MIWTERWLLFEGPELGQLCGLVKRAASVSRFWWPLFRRLVVCASSGWWNSANL